MTDKFIQPSPLNTAVLFLVFNRLDTTKEVFESIKEAKPPRLYIAADGARESINGEDKRVKESKRKTAPIVVGWGGRCLRLFFSGEIPLVRQKLF